MKMLEELRYFEANGEWPNNAEPIWAVKKAKELKCSTTSPSVIKWGLFQVINELEAQVSPPEKSELAQQTSKLLNETENFAKQTVAKVSSFFKSKSTVKNDNDVPPPAA